MKWSALRGLCCPERPGRVSCSVGVVPILGHEPSSESDGPFLATNSMGRLLLTRPSKESIVRYGFTYCEISNEARLFEALFSAVKEHAFPNVVGTVSEAVAFLKREGLAARTLVVPLADLKEAAGVELTEHAADVAMATRGCVVEMGEMRVLVSDLPPGHAVVGAAPSLVGRYVRAGDYLGLLFFRASSSFCLVRP